MKGEEVAGAVRAAILAGEIAPGARLTEAALTGRYEAARHTVRAALRQLAGEGLVTVEPNRGATVTRLDASRIAALFELRTALEVEAARLLRERHGLDPMPEGVLVAAAALEEACAVPTPDRLAVDDAHAALHHAIVAAAGSPRITQAHAALAAEGRVVLLQSRRELPADRMAALHRDLLAGLAERGPDALRTHLATGASSAIP